MTRPPTGAAHRRPRSPGQRGRGLVALVAASCLALTACAAVPDVRTDRAGPGRRLGGVHPVHPRDRRPAQPRGEPDRDRPRIPRGQRQPGGRPRDRPAVPDSRGGGIWDPTPHHRVQRRRSSSLGGEDSITARLDVTGELHAAGTLIRWTPPRPRRSTSRWSRSWTALRGCPQWRITDPPDELLVSDTDLRRAFRQHQVYFLGDARCPRAGRPTAAGGRPEPAHRTGGAGCSPGRRSGWRPECDRGTAGTALAFGAVPVTDGVAWSS